MFVDKTANENNFFTIKEIAEILNVPKRTVYRWAVSGILPCYKFGSTYRVYHKDFSNFIKHSKYRKPSK